jgi:hypothetical protein
MCESIENFGRSDRRYLDSRKTIRNEHISLAHAARVKALKLPTQSGCAGAGSLVVIAISPGQNE